MTYSSFVAFNVEKRMLIRSVPSTPAGPCFSRMPNGKAHVPLDACCAFTKSDAVSSSHFADSGCASDAAAKDNDSSTAVPVILPISDSSSHCLGFLRKGNSNVSAALDYARMQDHLGRRDFLVGLAGITTAIASRSTAHAQTARAPAPPAFMYVGSFTGEGRGH